MTRTRWGNRTSGIRACRVGSGAVPSRFSLPRPLPHTHTSFIEQTQYRQAICSVEMAPFPPCWTQARTLACGLCRCYYFLLFFPITTHVLVSFVTLLRTLHPLSAVLLSVLSLSLSLSKNCLEVRVMASGWGPPQLRRVRRGSSCFKRVQSTSAGPSDTCCCRCCFAGR